MDRNIVILVRQDGLGSVQPEDREFGRIMFDRFLHSLESRPGRPVTICFYTEGVKLACTGSPVLLSLRLLHGMGARIVLCRSCLERFGLTDRVEVGEIGGISEIARILVSADSVITV